MSGHQPKAEIYVMNAACEARQLVEVIAGPQPLSGRLKTALARVARVTGLNARRIRAFWNNEARAIRADELETMRAAAHGERPPHEELARLRDQINRLDWLLRTTNADAAGALADPYRRAVRPMGRADGAEDSPLD